MFVFPDISEHKSNVFENTEVIYSCLIAIWQTKKVSL